MSCVLLVWCGPLGFSSQLWHSFLLSNFPALAPEFSSLKPEAVCTNRWFYGAFLQLRLWWVFIVNCTCKEDSCLFSPLVFRDVLPTDSTTPAQAGAPQERFSSLLIVCLLICTHTVRDRFAKLWIEIQIGSHFFFGDVRTGKNKKAHLKMSFSLSHCFKVLNCLQ